MIITKGNSSHHIDFKEYKISTGSLITKEIHIFRQFRISNLVNYPLAFSKIVGLIFIISKKSKFFKELAYTVFLFDAIITFSAHLKAGDVEFTPVTVSFITITISFGFITEKYS